MFKLGELQCFVWDNASQCTKCLDTIKIWGTAPWATHGYAYVCCARLRGVKWCRLLQTGWMWITSFLWEGRLSAITRQPTELFNPSEDGEVLDFSFMGYVIMAVGLDLLAHFIWPW